MWLPRGHGCRHILAVCTKVVENNFVLQKFNKRWKTVFFNHSTITVEPLQFEDLPEEEIDVNFFFFSNYS